MAPIESLASIYTSYTLEQKIHFIFCIMVSCLICCAGCLWCCPLPDVFEASTFLPSLDFHHLHLLRDWEADSALCFLRYKRYFWLCENIQVAVTVSNVQARLLRCFSKFACGVCYFFQVIFCVLSGKRILTWICLIRLALSEPVCQSYLKVCVKDLLAPWAEC